MSQEQKMNPLCQAKCPYFMSLNKNCSKTYCLRLNTHLTVNNKIIVSGCKEKVKETN